MSDIYFTGIGIQVPLGARIGGGGEATIFEVPGARQPTVAKIYKKKPDKKSQEKLSALLTIRSPELLKLCAWPQELLFDRPHGSAIGFMMERLDNYEEIHKLYRPIDRVSCFPHADWSFLVQAARNAAAAVATVHKHLAVIGDINHSNIMVAENATVKLIDCDSFQITQRGVVYAAEVLTLDFAAPELRHGKVAPTNRTDNHDAFSLAVVVFQLLMNGRHPFAGRYDGTGEMPLVKSMAEWRYAYGARAADFQVGPPKNTLPIAALGPEIPGLFERSFSTRGAVSERPSAREWMEALERLSKTLVACSIQPAHRYVKTLSECPHCKLEAESGSTFFGSSVVFFRFDLQSIWSQIEEVKLSALASTFVPALHPALTQPLPADIAHLPASELTNNSLARLKLEVHDRRERLLVAKINYERFQERWKHEVSTPDFATLRREADTLRQEYENLLTQRKDLGKKELGKLRWIEMKEYLQRFPLRDAKFQGIGAKRLDTLNAYGIVTAADVTYRALAPVPGIGNALGSTLVGWRTGLEKQFVFDANQRLPVKLQTQIDQKFHKRVTECQSKLKEMPERLQMAKAQADTRRNALRTDGTKLAKELAQAEANFTFANNVLVQVISTAQPNPLPTPPSSPKLPPSSNRSTKPIGHQAVIILVILVAALLLLWAEHSTGAIRSWMRAGQITVVSASASSTPNGSASRNTGVSSGANHLTRLEADPVQATLSPLTAPTRTKISPTPSPKPATPTSNGVSQTDRVIRLVTTNRGSNLREGPGMEYAIHKTEKDGTILIAVGRNRDGSWIKLDNDLWIAAYLVDGSKAKLPVMDAPARATTLNP